MTVSLAEASDLHHLSERLGTRWLGHRLELLGAVESTNDVAMLRGREGSPHGTVVIADTQSRGRGRQGHLWHSPAGENLYLSALLRLAVAPAQVPPITLAVGVAVHRAVNSFGVAASLKWPNDVLVPGSGGDKKVSGILTEMSTRGGRVEHVVVGVGLNVNTERFPPELPQAISLRMATGGAPLDRGAVAAALLAALEVEIDRFVAGDLAGIVADWRARCGHLGRRVRVAGDDGHPVIGIAETVDDDGALRVLRDGGGAVRIVAGEIEALS